MTYPRIFERKGVEYLAIDEETCCLVDEIISVTTTYNWQRIPYTGMKAAMWCVSIRLKNGSILGWYPTGYSHTDYCAKRAELVLSMAKKINNLLQMPSSSSKLSPTAASDATNSTS